MSPNQASLSHGYYREGFEISQDSAYRSFQRTSRGGDKVLNCKIFIPALRVFSDWKIPSINFIPGLESDKSSVIATEFHSNEQKAIMSTTLNATTVAMSQVVCT